MEDNLKIYNAGRAVPKEAQKEFNNGRFSGTDINPMWRIKKLTELFGPAGIGWYYDVTSERAETVGDTVMAIVDLKLYIRDEVTGEWSKPIYGTGGNVLLAKGRASDEGYKMALTDALSVACKALGIGADIYFAKDRTKYTAEAGREDGRRAASSSPTGDGGTGERIAASPSAPRNDKTREGSGPAPGRQTKMGLTGICKRCKAEIDEQTESYTRQRFGVPLCRPCQAAAIKYEQEQAQKKGENNA